MVKEREEEIRQKILTIADSIEQNSSIKELSVENVNYYKEISFRGVGIQEQNVIVATIKNSEDDTTTYNLYSEDTNSLIATVDTTGKMKFTSDYIEKLIETYKEYFRTLDLDDVEFNFPQELSEEDIVFTKEERERFREERERSDTRGKEKSKEREQKEVIEEEREEEQEENKELTPEEKEREEIAKKKGIKSNDVLFIKENSNFYKDHPNLEKNLYFFRDKDGIVKAEYIDENGMSQPSKFFEPTLSREETISMGSDGNPVVREVPYQVLKTKGLNNIDKDIVDIRINIKIDSYGYLDIEESRQGKNGEWLAHDIEVKGRSYNSHELNERTSIKSRRADPDEQTNAYKQLEKNENATNDGIQYDEIYMQKHAEEIISNLQEEGYERDDAVQIYNYMLGEDLTLEQAKDKVNEQILERAKDKVNEQINERTKEVEKNTVDYGEREEIDNSYEGRTPGEDAWERRMYRGH